jgi:WD40 repeat protein/serine/threonine protein kinase/tetratricopeptide (TPR) repeat protein
MNREPACRPDDSPPTSAGAPDDGRVLRLSQEYLARLEAGQRPNRQELLARHPELATELAEALDALEFVHRAAPQLHPAAVEGLTPASPEALLAGPLGDYRILREVGRGGMGIVYEAEQLSLGRRVALKVLPFAAALDAKQLQRFKNEAHAAAHLHHQNIVPVYGVGSERGIHYYAMQFIEGRTLADVIRGLREQAGLEIPAAGADSGATADYLAAELSSGRGASAEAQPKQGDDRPDAPATQLTGPQSTDGSHRSRAFFRTAAQLGLQAAEALQHAHELGVVHRDIKPANLLMDVRGKLWITDFGLARLHDDAGLTGTGELLGTIRYMSPEQALGRHDEIDHRTDIYSLGVTLYELLALRPAFAAADRQTVLRQIVSEEPRPPRHGNPAVPAELETIVLKAMAKLPEERYATAQELADDLRRFLDDRPIWARRPTWLQLMRKWLRRHRKAVTAGVAGTVAALTVSTVLLALSELRTRDALGHAEARRAEAEEARGVTERTLTDLSTALGLAAAERDEPALALLWFAGAVARARNYPARQTANRVRVSVWQREVPTPVLALTTRGRPREVVFHPDGRHLLVLDHADGCSVWDAEQGEPLPLPGGPRPVSAAAWSPAGDWLVLGTPAGDADVFRFPGGERLHHLALGEAVRSLAFSPDGRYLAVGSARVRLWDRRTETFAGPGWPHPAPVLELAFATTGARLVTACADGFARVFAVPAGEAPLFPAVPCWGAFDRADEPLRPLFLDGDRGLLTRDRDGPVWWDAATGREVRRFHDTRNVCCLALSPDGRTFAIGGQSNPQLWEVSPPKPVGKPLQHRNGVGAVAFSPDGQSVLTVSGDRTARLWSVPAGEPLTAPLAHQDSATLAAFAPDGRSFATAQLDGLVRVWRVPHGRPGDHRLACGKPTSVKVSRDGRFVVAVGADKFFTSDLRGTRVYEAATGRLAGPAVALDGTLADADLSPDGRRLVTLCSRATAAESVARVVEPEGKAGHLQLWDVATGKPVAEPVPLPSDPRYVAYDPTGRHVVAVCVGGQALLLDAEGGQVLRRVQHDCPAATTERPRGACFTPDGQRFVTYGSDDAVNVWDTATGQRCYPPLRHGGYCKAAAVSADGHWLVTAGMDRTARVWDLATGQPAAEPLVHPGWLFDVCFSPDGQRVLTACRDGQARLWDWRTGRLACPPFKHADEVFAAAFSPDGRWVLTGSADGTARVWEPLTGKPVTPSLEMGAQVWSVCLAGGGRYAVLAGAGPDVLAVDLQDLAAPAGLDPAALVTWGELLAGARLGDGDVAGLSSAEWLERWRGLGEQRPRDGLEDVLAWHRQGTDRDEAAGAWSAALWHLDRLLAATPKDGQLLGRRARAHQELRQYDEAGADYVRLLEVQPGDRDARYQLARCHTAAGFQRFRRGDLTAAEERYRTALDLLAPLTADEPCRAEYRVVLAYTHNVLAWLLASRPEQRPDDPARALASARQAVELEPQVPGYWNTLGMARYRTGDAKGAVAALQKTVDMDRGGYASTWFLLALAHARLGEREEARRWYDRAARWLEGHVGDDELHRYQAEAAALLEVAKQP